MLRWRWILLAICLVAVLWSIDAVRTFSARARAEERRQTAISFGLPPEAVIIEVREAGSWMFRDIIVDFRLPGPGSPEHKLLKQATRSGMQQCRKGRYHFRTPRNDFGYHTLEYLPATDRYRAGSFW